ncbi:hypothetical protein [Paramicrobacterium fandaimingii]|uniref:hypothetical protein n=1 Tax=Paramicrobacterium fandaimingii TaxID=2708079 RepID=UPI001424A786|nr:hypothetical protein [Microbacterium fandaimingii]
MSDTRSISVTQPVARALSGVALLGAGLVHLAIAPAQAAFSLSAIVIVAVGELALAIALLSGGVRLTATLPSLCCIPTVLWAVLELTSASSALAVGPMLTATVLGLFAGGALAISVRRSAPPHPRRFTYMVTLALGCALLPLAAVPAMAAAQYPADQPSMQHEMQHGTHHH